MDGLVDYFFDVDDFMDKCPKFKPEMDAILVPYKKMCKNVQKRINQSEITSASLRLPFLPLHRTRLVFRSTRELSATGVDLISINTNTNTFVFIKPYFTYYPVYCVFGSPNHIFPIMS